MSEHTKGRLAVKGEWIIPEAHADRMIGSSTNKADDKSNYAHTVAIVRGKYQDDKANARRLAAAWNACEGIDTGALERVGDNFIKPMIDLQDQRDAAKAELNAANARIAKLEALAQQQDTWLGKKTCAHSRCSELNAARALLREVYADGYLHLRGASLEILDGKISDYLDACDKPGEPT